MNKFLALLIYITSIFVFVLALPGCSIGLMESREQRLNELVNSIDPFDFGDEFMQNTTKGKDSNTTESTLVKDNSDNSIHSDTNPLGPENEQKLINNTTIPYTDLTANRFGYRVQIGAFEYKENAEEVKKFAHSKTDLPIYIVYIAPFYRVRAGDFAEKSEAEKYVKILKDKGFDDARWVHTQINTP